MPENTTPVSLQDTYAPGKWTRFLWWLSTAEPELLETCVVDRNRYAIVGATVLGTWSFATLAWTYFFSTVITNAWLAFLPGIFMGWLILTIDRALIKGISRANKKRWVPLLFRGALALVIGLFMAQPALLYLFDKEIHVQISLDNEQRKKDKKQKQDSVYHADRNLLLQQESTIRRGLAQRYEEVTAARESFIAETDGTGGSRKIGLKDIAQAKQKNYEQLDAAYRQTDAQLRPQLAHIDSAINAIDANVQKEQAAFESLLNDGFITRIEALNHLVRDNGAVAFRYYLLVAILLLIELMPVISKTMLPEGSYEEKKRLREEMERELIRNNHHRELALKELFNNTAFEQHSVLIREFFGATQQDMKEQLSRKFTDRKGNADELWTEIKNDMMYKSEQ